MNIENKYKEHVLSNLTPKDDFKELSAKLDFNTPKNKNMKKKGIIVFTSCVCACVAIGIGAYVLIGNTNPNNNDDSKLAMVKMNLNPSISFVVDGDNKVVSVTGENNEGKMIIAGEEIVGKDLSEAIEIILITENETGYLVSGNVSVDDNNLSFTVNIDDEKLAAEIQNQITTTVNEVCEELNVEKHVEYLKAYTDEELNKLVLELDPTLTEEDVNAMTYEQKINVIKLYQLETAELYSEELEELYTQVKEYDIKFAESEFTKEAISSMGMIYEIYLSGFDIALNLLQSSIDSLNTIRYNQFVSEESAYQTAYASLLEAKEEVIAYKNQLAQVEAENTEKKKEILKLLEAKEELLDTLTKALETQKDNALALIDSAVLKIEESMTQLEEYKASLPNQEKVMETLTSKALELESKVNEVKDNAFAEFESKYSDDILAAKEEVLAYKQSLKDSLKQGE